MVATVWRSLTVFIVVAVLAWLPAAASEVTVFAAASLTDALQQIGKNFQAQTGEQVKFNFAGSNVLARQMLEGAPVDVFLSADEAEMDAVSKAGLLVEASRHDLLSNSLVIIVPQESKLTVRGAGDLARPEVRRIALGDPQMVPAGVYAKAFLQRDGIWSSVQSRVIPAVNVRAALAAVASGDADAGIVYKTDAFISKGVKVAYEIPDTAGPKIRYPAALGKGSQNPKTAGRFLEYLRSPDAAKIFTQYGFVMAE